MTMKRIPGAAGRPYANVQGFVRADGSVTYAATLPSRTIRGRRVSKHLGLFDKPELAHVEVLQAQADGLAAKAARYRREADRILTGLLTAKRGRRAA